MEKAFGGSDRERLDRELSVRGEEPTTAAEWVRWRDELDAFGVFDLADAVVAHRQEKPRRLPRPKDVGEAMASAEVRARALSLWAARIAEGGELDASSPKLSAVRVWRWHHLGGAEGRPVRLLAEREVDGWILDAWRASAVADRDLEVAPSERLSDLPAPGGVPLEWRRRVGRRWEVVAWSVPREHQALGGRDGLAVLVGDLVRWFSWEPAEATAFVLCGVVPAVQPITGHYVGRAAQVARMAERHGSWPGWLEPASVTAFDRVEVSLDPALSVEQIAAWWGAVRQQFAPEGGWAPAQGEVGNELAGWMAGVEQTDGEVVWWKLRERWNAKHAGRSSGPRGPGRPRRDEPVYEVRRDFQKRATTAVRRLLSLGAG
jgi:hypothetical protein